MKIFHGCQFTLVFTKSAKFHGCQMHPFKIHGTHGTHANAPSAWHMLGIELHTRNLGMNSHSFLFLEMWQKMMAVLSTIYSICRKWTCNKKTTFSSKVYRVILYYLVQIWWFKHSSIVYSKWNLDLKIQFKMGFSSVMYHCRFATLVLRSSIDNLRKLTMKMNIPPLWFKWHLKLQGHVALHQKIFLLFKS